METPDWMFVQTANPDWSPDLGYWIGYRIAKSYYDHAQDKRQASFDILSVTDYDAFLRASGYPDRARRFAKPTTARQRRHFC